LIDEFKRREKRYKEEIIELKAKKERAN